ncbi:SDR family oxidoreductase [Helcococcus kunzii]|uniref:SDR family oxidoreductase n=1 Tax=Helcococcus kunzii TaxID=40091 RepID=UPI0024ADE133|nr:SDR family oxidoreductase [Helcococcus kunzii]
MKKPKLIDPRKLYKTGKFKDQEQDTPALQDEMIPEPDCGEDSYVGSEKLLNRNALITGGDSGIGRAVAIAYAREGANVAIQFFPGEEQDANEVKELIEKEGRKALLIPIDLREENAATEIVEKTVEEFGQLDILVLNAAQQIAIESLEELSIKQVEDSFKVNVISMFETTKDAEKYLEAGSTIVITSSVQSYNPSPTLLDYAATKAATKNFTLGIAKYFAPKGIRVNGVAPGPIWTPLQLDDGQPEGKIPEFGQNSLLERAGQPAELAHVYVYLASNESSYVTSQIYGITGGEAID